MSARPTDPPAQRTAGDAEVVRLTVRLAAVMLAAGAQTDDIEDAIGIVSAAYGVADVEYAVTFSSITVSHDDPGARRPATFQRIVRERHNDFARLAQAASIVDRIRDKNLRPRRSGARGR